MKRPCVGFSGVRVIPDFSGCLLGFGLGRERNQVRRRTGMSFIEVVS